MEKKTEGFPSEARALLSSVSIAHERSKAACSSSILLFLLLLSLTSRVSPNEYLLKPIARDTKCVPTLTLHFFIEVPQNRVTSARTIAYLYIYISRSIAIYGQKVMDAPTRAFASLLLVHKRYQVAGIITGDQIANRTKYGYYI